MSTMILVKIGDQMVGIPSQLLAQAFMANMPKFLTGEETVPALSTKAAIKSAVKNLLPMLLGLMHKEIQQKHLPMVPPDLKCQAAKQNIVTYATVYMLGNAAALATQQVFLTEGVMQDGVLVLTGLSAAPAALGEADTGIAASDKQPAIAAPDAETSGD